jgi:hypothetical protein
MTDNFELIKEDVSRVYYYDIEGKKVPDIESMVAYLIDAGVLCVGVNKYQCSSSGEIMGPTLTLHILINDYFHPASDGEDISYDEVPRLYELYREKDWKGTCEFVADKRGIPNKHWRDTYAETKKI